MRCAIRRNSSAKVKIRPYSPCVRLGYEGLDRKGTPWERGEVPTPQAALRTDRGLAIRSVELSPAAIGLSGRFAVMFARAAGADPVAALVCESTVSQGLRALPV